jgi:glycerol-3-phosphate dehydrogenase
MAESKHSSSGRIVRDVESAAQRTYDLLVIGGGIQGVCMALEASRRGLNALLIERDDFGGATSWNSLRIVHGGLRYLQKLDLRRYRESVAERKWFCQNFPELVAPLSCVMPLYGRGLKRPGVFRLALALNDILSRERNAGLLPDSQIPCGRLWQADEVCQEVDNIDAHNLRGGGQWHDAVMVNPQRLLIELLRWACHVGAVGLNYVEAVDLHVDSDGVEEVVCRDRVAEREITFKAKAVVNCAGPWSRLLAAKFDCDLPRLYHPTLAFNVLLNRQPMSSSALALATKTGDEQIYFLLPYGDKILAGTAHLPWTGPLTRRQVRDDQLDSFLNGLNEVAPDLQLTRDAVLRVFSGFMPGVTAGGDKVSRRPIIHDHARHGGPRGLFSVSGVKYTTARDVAQKALYVVFAGGKRDLSYRPDTNRPPSNTPQLDLQHPDALLNGDDPQQGETLRRLVQDESVVYLDDLLLRRTDWLADPRNEAAIVKRVSTLLNWRGSKSIDDADGSNVLPAVRVLKQRDDNVSCD